MKIRSRVISLLLLGHTVCASADTQDNSLFHTVDDETAERVVTTEVLQDECVIRYRVALVDLEFLARQLDYAQLLDNPLDSYPITIQLFTDLTILVRPRTVLSDSKYGFLMRSAWYQGTELGADEDRPLEYGVSGRLLTKDRALRKGNFNTLDWTVGIKPAKEPPYVVIYESDSRKCDWGM